METLKIAVTGASGFVGANLVRQLSKANDVVAFSRKKGGWRLDSFETTPLDLNDLAKVRIAIRRIRPDAVIHCAVYGGYNFERDTYRIINTNVLDTVNLLAACSNVPIFINTGSSSEYGIKKKPMKETDVAEPRTDYALSKALITSLIASGRYNAITLRLFSVYGYYEEKHRLVPNLIYSAITNRTARLVNKTNVRDFIFIQDVARAYELAIRRWDRIEKGSVFNVGSGKETTIIEVAKRIGVRVRIAPDMRETEPKMRWQADITKIKKGLGWKPNYSLQEGLDATKEWMIRNMDLYNEQKNDKYARVRNHSE
jgi:nucleoside-diphosphate-sugar epimerase